MTEPDGREHAGRGLSKKRFGSSRDSVRGTGAGPAFKGSAFKVAAVYLTKEMMMSQQMHTTSHSRLKRLLASLLDSENPL